jgi:hypothetical protein
MTDQTQDPNFSATFPKLHQFIFVRNDSWPQSIWLGVWGLLLLTVTFLFSFVLKPPVVAVWNVLLTFSTGIILCLRLSWKFVIYGLLGFLSSRNVTVEQLLKEALSKILTQAQQRAIEAQQKSE